MPQQLGSILYDITRERWHWSDSVRCIVPFIPFVGAHAPFAIKNGWWRLAAALGVDSQKEVTRPTLFPCLTELRNGAHMSRGRSCLTSSRKHQPPTPCSRIPHRTRIVTFLPPNSTQHSLWLSQNHQPIHSPRHPRYRSSIFAKRNTLKDPRPQARLRKLDRH